MFLCTGFQSYLYHTRLGEFEQVIYCVWASVVLPENGGIIPPKMLLEGLRKIHIKHLARHLVHNLIKKVSY